MAKLNVYLNFAGNAEEAFNFYRSVFGTEFTSVVRYKDMPMPDVKLREEEEDRIMHIALPVGNGDVLMASDVLESMGQSLSPGNNVYLSLHPDSRDETDRLFKALSQGGAVDMPLEIQAWGDYYGMLKDRYGVLWMLNHDEARL